MNIVYGSYRERNSQLFKFKTLISNAQHTLKDKTSLDTGQEFESIGKFLIGNRLHVILRIVSSTTLFKQNKVEICLVQNWWKQSFFVVHYNILNYFAPNLLIRSKMCETSRQEFRTQAVLRRYHFLLKFLSVTEERIG